MRHELQWKVVENLPAVGRTITHLKLIEVLKARLTELLSEKYCAHEVAERYESEMIDQIVDLEYRLAPAVKLEMKAGVYHLGWCEAAVATGSI
jgi:hypothetical protein